MAEPAVALCHPVGPVDPATVLGEPVDRWATGPLALELIADGRRRAESELGHLPGLREWLP